MGNYDARISVTGDGVPLVLVPGLDGTGSLFYRQVPHLVRAGYRVATWALRDSADSMSVLIEDLRAVVDEVAPDGAPVVLVGESFGGALSMSFALAHPDRVTRLVVLNSFPFFSPQARLWLGIAALSAVPWGAMAVVRRLTASRLHSRHTHRDDIQEFLRLTQLATRRGYLGRLRILTRYDLRERLAAVRVPTLFLASDEDHLVPAVMQARAMAARVPNAAVRVLAGHGHICLIAPDLDLGRILGEWT